jgi:predicted GIY-YIG superfamily endonuclease
VPGTVYVLHLDPPYKHAGHYVGWTATDVQGRLATHLAGRGSPLIRAAVAAGAQVELADTMPGSRALERRLKRWHKTSQFCPVCRARRHTPTGGAA